MRPARPPRPPARAAVPRPRALLLAAALAAAGPLAAPAAGAGLVEENLYPAPPAGAAAAAPFAQTVVNGVHAVRAGAGHVGEGQKWRAHWACAVPGSELAALRWSAMRRATPSALEIEVRGGGHRVWAEGDVAMSKTGRNYEVGLPPGTCAASLALRQVAGGHQHDRTYLFRGLQALVRDIAPPTVGALRVSPGWTSAGHADVAWSVADNFGSEGIAAQRVLIAGSEVWSGAPGQGEHRIAAALGGIPDGVHAVAVEAAGDGTPAGTAAGAALHVDRTPPAVRALSAVNAAPGRADFSWTASDALSGVRSAHVEVNAAADGSAGGPWIEVGAAPGGAGALHGRDLRGMPDGAHAWRVRAVDEAGNAGVAPGPARLLLDTTPPAVILGPMPAAPVSRLPLKLALSDNLAPLIGMGPTVVALNSAPGGRLTGRWVPQRVLRLPAGRHVESVPISGVSDGRHALAVSVHNGGPFGKRLSAQALAEVLVDTTPPALEPPAFATAGHERLEVAWVADDALSGVASVAVQWHDGRDWRTLESRPARDGARTLTVDVGGVPDGLRPIRLAVADRAGNVAVAAAPGGGAAIDHRPPAVAGLRLQGPPWRLAWRQADPGGGFGACETAVQVAGPGTEGEWREVLARRLGEGPQSARLPLEGLAPGAYRVRVVACDAAGNTGVGAPAEVLRIASWSAPLGAASPTADPFSASGARLSLRAPGARLERRGGHDVLVRRVRFGRSLLLQGRLRAPAGGPLRRARVEVRGPGGRVVGRGRTGADGRFRLRARPDAGGPLRIGVADGGAPVPARSDVGLRVEVLPRVSLRVSDPRPAAGARVAFSGRVLPAPRRVGAGSKGIVLEWRDPLRREWRPVVNARTRPDGTFRIGWDFNLAGLAIPLRLRVPREGGWPLLPATSEQVTVTVG